MAKKKTSESSSDSTTLYSYHCGERVPLVKRPDQFIARMRPDELAELDLELNEIHQVSSGSTCAGCAPERLDAIMDEVRAVAPVHHAYVEIDGESVFLITDRLLISFQPDLDAEAAARFAGEYGLEMLATYSAHDYLFRLTDSTGMNPVKLVVRLVENEQDRVRMVDHDLNMIGKRHVAQDPFYERQWHLHARLDASDEYDPRSSAGCEAAWMLIDEPGRDGFGSEEVVIGVTDDGCDLDHPDFDGLDKFAGWGYFEGNRFFRRGDPGADPLGMYQPGEDHGTSCAGVIAAEIDGEMTVGAAPGCRLLPIKWEVVGDGGLAISDSKLLAALDYVADKVDVLSNSWGSTPTTRVAMVVQDRLRELARTGGRRGRGILFLWAAGNENCPLDYVAEQPVPYDSGVEVRGDRAVWVGVRSTQVFRNQRVGIPGVMHVAALASTAQRSHYSNYGPGVDLTAPSSNSHAYWRLNVPGLGVTTATGSDSLVTHRFGGTSSATPLVAGVAGLVISAHPELSALEVASVLESTASKDLSFDPYPRTPPASYDPDTSWDVSPVAPLDDGSFQNTGESEGTWSPWFGHGRVDAEAAVRKALELAGVNRRGIFVSRDADLDIPDANPAGVVSTLFVEADGRAASVRVKVDVTHEYRGDLRVSLRAPDGSSVLLHDRGGASAQNLVATFDAGSVPGLSILHGTDVRGTWALEVADEAPDDVGVLNRWSLEIDTLGDGTIRRESMSGQMIPDDEEEGVTNRLTIGDSLTIGDVAVEVDVTHTYIGDLTVVLRGPSGGEVVLHDREGGSTDNLRRTYTVDDVDGLATFEGRSARGEWSLTVVDHAGADVGKLNRWALILR